MGVGGNRWGVGVGGVGGGVDEVGFDWIDRWGFCFFFFNDTATTEIYTLSLHDALPISLRQRLRFLYLPILAAAAPPLFILPISRCGSAPLFILPIFRCGSTPAYYTAHFSLRQRPVKIGRAHV